MATPLWNPQSGSMLASDKNNWLLHAEHPIRVTISDDFHITDELLVPTIRNYVLRHR